jgi:hypothetical protein
VHIHELYDLLGGLIYLVLFIVVDFIVDIVAVELGIVIF